MRSCKDPDWLASGSNVLCTRPGAGARDHARHPRRGIAAGRRLQLRRAVVAALHGHRSRDRAQAHARVRIALNRCCICRRCRLLLAGEPPWLASTAAALLANRLPLTAGFILFWLAKAMLAFNASILACHRSGELCPQAVADLIIQCMDRNPAQRSTLWREVSA